MDSGLSQPSTISRLRRDNRRLGCASLREFTGRTDALSNLPSSAALPFHRSAARKNVEVYEVHYVASGNRLSSHGKVVVCGFDDLADLNLPVFVGVVTGDQQVLGRQDCLDAVKMEGFSILREDGYDDGIGVSPP